MAQSLTPWLLIVAGLLGTAALITVVEGRSRNLHWGCLFVVLAVAAFWCLIGAALLWLITGQ